jgi:UDP-2-acetamido-2,6-beta-L-arabino-hexul-4-ose reductase
MKLLITGAGGFIGKNLQAITQSAEDISLLCAYHNTPDDELSIMVAESDWIVHLAGVNRPTQDHEYASINVGYTKKLCSLAAASSKCPPIIFSSSTQVSRDNHYGASKLEAERLLLEYSAITRSPVYILRLPNVMGKWCRPNYNSVVATFCHNVSHGLPIEIHDPLTELTLVYIDDLVIKILDIIRSKSEIDVEEGRLLRVFPEYKITLGDLADRIREFRESRTTLKLGRVGKGFDRALYATYLSYLDVQDFFYPLQSHEDDRGIFVEFLKTADSGQFSFLTAHPGVTRGMHYHHTKSEKFLVVKGTASFRFKKLFSDEVFEIHAEGAKPIVVETVPGWTHDITNIGQDDLVVLIWANEVFSPETPDTYASTF